MLKGNVQEKRGYLHTVISYKDENGVRKKKWQSTGLTAKGNIRKAEAILKERMEAFELELKQKQSDKSNEDILFSKFLSNWLAMVKSTLLITTYGGYQYFIEQRINPYFDEKKMTLQKITMKDIQEYYNTMLTKGTKWNSVVKHHAIIRKALDYAVKMDYIPSNPAARIETPKRQKYIAEHYNQDELNQLFEVIKGDPAEVAIILTAYYGLRRSEVLGLKWSAIDFKEKTLCIRHTVCKTVLDGQQIVVQKDTTKNKASIRTLPLIPEIEELLLETKKKQEACRKKAKGSYCKDYLDYVCVDSLGVLLKPDYLTQHFEIIIKKNKPKKIRYHDLRHSCASLLLANGVSLKEIQDWLGHSDYSTTANIYSHLEYGAKLKSAGKISETLNIKREKKDGE